MAVSANTLFHFTDKLDNLKGILKSSFHPRYSLEDLSNAVPGKVYVARIPMVCFCDLLLSQIKDHIKFYGDYGMGLRKKGWGNKKGISPIIYLPKKSISSLLLKEVTNQYRVLLQAKTDSSIHKHLPEFYKYIKAYAGLAQNKRTKEMESRIFYDEREWRYSPNNFPVLPERIEDHGFLEKENKKIADSKPLTFAARDIKYIIVKKEKEISSFADFIISNLKKEFIESERNLLISKLISVEQIRDDM